ncbi:nadp-binding domain [Trichoderma arundinaceum]|uniref:Nadp-binding domain n=1 Tax=Trichoderma arundinaceum TaxID=490622 RepID=A0A395NTL8_TRIAR|nr:nadp-binding domain [Trichoderma arundinaceum]
MSKFHPDVDIGDLSGKVILVTGGTDGIGKQSVISLAKHAPSHIYFSGRDEKAAEQAGKHLVWAGNRKEVSLYEKCGRTSCTLGGLLALSPQSGANSILWAATADKIGVESCRLYVPIGKAREQEKAGMDEGAAQQLWDWTQNELEGFS